MEAQKDTLFSGTSPVLLSMEEPPPPPGTTILGLVDLLVQAASSSQGLSGDFAANSSGVRTGGRGQVGGCPPPHFLD